MAALREQIAALSAESRHDCWSELEAPYPKEYCLRPLWRGHPIHMGNRKLFLNEFRVLRAIFARKKEWRRPLLVFPFSPIFNEIDL